MMLCQEYWETGREIQACPKTSFLAIQWHFLTLSIVSAGLSGAPVITFLLQVFYFENKLMLQL